MIISNTAGLVNYGAGGGVLFDRCDATIANNQIRNNVASRGTGYGWGGGIYVYFRDPVVQGNLVQGNWARKPGQPGGYGAGIYQWYGGGVIADNLVTGSAYGGSSVYLGYSTSLFERNTIVDNSTSTGLQMKFGGGATANPINNIIARSGTSRQVGLSGSATDPLTATLSHNTIVCSGPETGVSVDTGYVDINL